MKRQIYSCDLCKKDIPITDQDAAGFDFSEGSEPRKVALHNAYSHLCGSCIKALIKIYTIDKVVES